MAYATVYQVAARNAARGSYSQNTIPSASQVTEFIFESAAQLDAWLFAGGYAAPFDTSIASGLIATSAQMLLQRWNVSGAALMVEDAAVTSDRVDEFRKMWEEIQMAIMDKSIDLPLPMNPAKKNPRGLGKGKGTAQAQELLISNTPHPHHWDL